MERVNDMKENMKCLYCGEYKEGERCAICGNLVFCWDCFDKSLDMKIDIDEESCIECGETICKNCLVVCKKCEYCQGYICKECEDMIEICDICKGIICSECYEIVNCSNCRKEHIICYNCLEKGDVIYD
jgi:hypothetical protein